MYFEIQFSMVYFVVKMNMVKLVRKNDGVYIVFFCLMIDNYVGIFGNGIGVFYIWESYVKNGKCNIVQELLWGYGFDFLGWCIRGLIFGGS